MNIGHAIEQLDADLVCLQEVRFANRREQARFARWPEQPQADFLAPEGYEPVYRTNAITRHGEHGNALLSRWPVLSHQHEDMSDHRFEQRGLLHCEIAVPQWPRALHCVCVHLALTARGRGRQMERLRQRIERLVPAEAPLIVAGDFNDWYWRHRATHELAHPLNMHEVFELSGGSPARSFPAVLPLLRLDRIYVRGFRVREARVHHGKRWGRVSDHAPLTAQLERLPD